MTDNSALESKSELKILNKSNLENKVYKNIFQDFFY